MKSILVTGAARGIGLALIERAVARGDNVFAAVRKESDKLRFDPHPNLYPIIMNVADTRSVERAYEEVDAHLAGRRLDAVINSAAISHPGAIEVTPVLEYEELLNTNTIGSLRVLKGAIPRLRGHGGRMIFITSLWGCVSGSMLSAYCMSKHAIESLADVARREVDGMNMHVIVVAPGVVRTDMYKQQAQQVQMRLNKLSDSERIYYGLLYERYLELVGGSGAPDRGITAQQCAFDIERALFDIEPETRYQSGDDAKKLCALARQLSDREMDDLMRDRLSNR